jgi:hypothetical protein
MTATSGAITHTLHRLEYAGLVARLVNPDDGRSLYVALTRRGLELTDTVGPLDLDNERRLLAGLTPDEQRTLAHLLRKLLLGFERDQPAPHGRLPGQPGGTGPARGRHRRPAQPPWHHRVPTGLRRCPAPRPFETKCGGATVESGYRANVAWNAGSPKALRTPAPTPTRRY